MRIGQTRRGSDGDNEEQREIPLLSQSNSDSDVQTDVHRRGGRKNMEPNWILRISWILPNQLNCGIERNVFFRWNSGSNGDVDWRLRSSGYCSGKIEIHIKIKSEKLKLKFFSRAPASTFV